jgi:hypothetical protein
MEIAESNRTKREAVLRRRLANLEQCLAEARAPDVLAFLEGMREEVLAELGRAARRPDLRVENVVPLFPLDGETADHVA